MELRPAISAKSVSPRKPLIASAWYDNPNGLGTFDLTLLALS